jgi:hypothetical protein
MYSKAERLTRLRIFFTLTVIQIAFLSKNNTTNIILTCIVENLMY